MDLYDDIDTKQRSSQVDGWSSGIKMLQTQLALKKATSNAVKEANTKKPPVRLKLVVYLKFWIYIHYF